MLFSALCLNMKIGEYLLNEWLNKDQKKGQVSVRRNNRKRKIIIHSHLPNSYSGPGALLGNERGYRSTNVSFLK